MPPKKSTSVPGSGTELVVVFGGHVEIGEQPASVFAGKPMNCKLKSVLYGIDPLLKVTIWPPSSNEPVVQVLKFIVFIKAHVTMPPGLSTSKVSDVMFWPVPLGFMTFAKKQSGDVPVITGGAPKNDWKSTQALDAGLLPLGDSM